MADVTGATLREMKMRRVENFLKEKLGVDFLPAKEGEEKPQTGKIVIENNSGKEDGISKLNEEYPKDSDRKKISSIEEMNNSSQFKDGNCSDAVAAGNKFEHLPASKDVGEDSTDENDRKTKLLKQEAVRLKIVNEGLIFPEHDKVQGFIVGGSDEMVTTDHVPHDAIETRVDFADDAGTTSIASFDAEKIDGAQPAPVPIDVIGIPKPVPCVKYLEEVPQLTPDLIGLYTLTLPVAHSTELTLFSSLKEDIAWFDTPVSLFCMEDTNGVNGGGFAMLEVKLRDMDMAVAVLNGLKHKYPGLEGDMTGVHSDILPDKETGLFTLCFADIKRKRYKATMEKFKLYSKQLPLISRGLGADQVLVAFHVKEEAVMALRDNLENEEFPELHVASVSRS
eukprot:GFUD01026839.1.p1 GENE.GFUD01026839.1~~GFUD01026839.1.p1  ORF type:complete len:459 (+),score=149.93 GFUD01026839.1:197-1378(+)